MPSTRSSSKGRPAICTPMGKPSGDQPTGTTAAGAPSKLKPLRVAHGVEVFELLPIHIPATFPVAKGGNRADRTKKNGKLLHLRQQSSAHVIAIHPGRKQFLRGERRLAMSNGEKVKKRGAQLRYAVPAPADREAWPRRGQKTSTTTAALLRAPAVETGAR